MDKRLEKYQIKNLKTMRGNEGDAFEASLYRAGKRIGVVWYDGWGGDYCYDIPADALEELGAVGRELYNAGCVERGTERYAAKDDESVPDVALEEIVRKVEEEQDRKREAARMRRQAKRDTLFVLEGEDESESYRFYRGVPYGARVLFHCRKQNGEGVRVYVPALDAWQPISEAIAPYEGTESQTA